MKVNRRRMRRARRERLRLEASWIKLTRYSRGIYQICPLGTEWAVCRESIHRPGILKIVATFPTYEEAELLVNSVVNLEMWRRAANESQQTEDAEGKSPTGGRRPVAPASAG